MGSGVESFLTGFAKETTKGLGKSQDTYNQLYIKNYLEVQSRNLPKYKYMNVKGVGAVRFDENAEDPQSSMKIIAPESTELSQSNWALTDSEVRSIYDNGGVLTKDQRAYANSKGIYFDPKNESLQENGTYQIIGTKTRIEEKDNKLKNLGALGFQYNEAYNGGYENGYYQSHFGKDAVALPVWPIDEYMGEANKFLEQYPDMASALPDNPNYKTYLPAIKMFTLKVRNLQIQDVLSKTTAPVVNSGSNFFTQRIDYKHNLLEFIKKEITDGGIDEKKITPEMVYNHYNILKDSNRIDTVSDISNIVKTVKERINQPLKRVLPTINSMNELTGKEIGFEFTRGGKKYKIISFDKDGEAILDEVQ